MAAPYIQKSAAERGRAQFAIGCRTDSERRRVCCKFRCKCSKTTTRRTVRVVWDVLASASGSRALRPGSFIGPMQQTRDSPEFRLIFQVTLNHRLLSAEAGAACRHAPRPATRCMASTGSSTTSPRSHPARSNRDDATIVRRVRELIARPRRDHCVFGGRSLWEIALRHKENQ